MSSGINTESVGRIFCGQKIDRCNFRTTSKQVRLTLAILESKVLAKQL